MTIYTDLAHIPDAEYNVIYADCPWPFQNYSKKNVIPQRAKKQHYPAMTMEQLKALDVDRIAAKNCALLMWIVDPNLEQALDLAKAWGFEYKTIAFHWVKTEDDYGQMSFFPPAFRMSMGYYTRKEAETVLLFTKGKPKRISKGVRQVIAAPRRQHSRKPDEARDRVAALFGGKRLEMFARQEFEGFDQFGNEVKKFK